MKKQNLIFIAILTCIALPIIAATGVPELDRLKGIYNREITRLKTKSQSERLHVPQEHISAMRKMEQEYQQSGDLINLLAVRKERERFIGDPRPDAIDPVSSPQNLRSLQQSYIQNYKLINSKKDELMRKTKDQYISRLQSLQKSLTKRGEIESAMAVMKEIESVESGGQVAESDEIASASVDSDSASGSPRSELDTATLSSLLHGKVTRWNSYNHEITLEYDFKAPEQLEDWKDGELDAFSNVINCKQTITWLKVQFSEIKKVECSIYLNNPSLRSGFVIGRSLTAVIESDRSINGSVFQSSEEHPSVRAANIEKTNNNAYHSTLLLNDKSLSWGINNERVRRGTLLEKIKYPTFIGFGCSDSTSSYGSIKITGVLSTKEIARLKKKLAGDSELF